MEEPHFEEVLRIFVALCVANTDGKLDRALSRRTGGVNILEWARLPGDALFIGGGALPLVWLCWQALRYPNPRRIEAEPELPHMLYTYESDR